MLPFFFSALKTQDKHIVSAMISSSKLKFAWQFLTIEHVNFNEEWQILKCCGYVEEGTFNGSDYFDIWNTGIAFSLEINKHVTKTKRHHFVVTGNAFITF